ncbi:unnamed protein product [Linum trigynum]|uniref:Gnk2-homologous domain-containing protein n=1 Tax=Linum trigynum TaxID=586398 RepID=A0AAV2E902_9ROSI
MDLCGTKDDQRLCTASNSNGFCNPDDFKVENPMNFKATFLDSLAQSNIYDNGRKTGCHRITFEPPVYSYYCCGRDFEDRCPDCFGRAVKRMKDGCTSRSGGNVLLDICSLRYKRRPTSRR